MDWRYRKYYCVSFDPCAHDMRVRYLKFIDGLKFHSYKDIPKQPDETEERGYYQYLISVLSDDAEAIEYELRKAERRDGWCRWKEIVKCKLDG